VNFLLISTFRCYSLRECGGTDAPFRYLDDARAYPRSRNLVRQHCISGKLSCHVRNTETCLNFSQGLFKFTSATRLLITIAAPILSNTWWATHTEFGRLQARAPRWRNDWHHRPITCHSVRLLQVCEVVLPQRGGGCRNPFARNGRAARSARGPDRGG
jgi:hypothetical protein